MFYLGLNDVFLLKYDSSRALLWTRQTGSTSNDRGNSVAVSGDGFIFVAGYTGGALNGQVSAGVCCCCVLANILK